MAEDYEIRDGDCLNSIASERGFLWSTIWYHGRNAELRRKRSDPNVLYQGDLLFIPDRELKEEPRPTDQRHRFQKLGEPAKLKLRLMRTKTEEDKPKPAPPPAGSSLLGGLADAVGLPVPGGGGDDSGSHHKDPDYVPPKEEEEPIANADYVLEIDGVRVSQKKTDGEGRLEEPIPPRARVGRLVVHPGLPEERVMTFDLGSMDPVEESSGVRKRLRNLGFYCAPDGTLEEDEVKQALRRFQSKNGLDPTGNADSATRSKLKELHGS